MLPVISASGDIKLRDKYSANSRILYVRSRERLISLRYKRATIVDGTLAGEHFTWPV